MKVGLLLLFAVIVAGCGTISSREYTDLAMEAATLRAQVASNERAFSFDKGWDEMKQSAFEQFWQQWQMMEGRRAHRPSRTP